MGKKFDRIYIELTNSCNFNCPFCSGIKRVPQDMTQEEILSILGQVGQFTDEVCLHVLGEPLLYTNLEFVLATCKNNSIKVNLVTNGYYMLDRLQILLKYANIFKKISISAHSYVFHQSSMSLKLINILNSSIALSNVGVSIEIRNLANNCNVEFSNALISAIKSTANVDLLDVARNQKIKDKLFYVVKKPFEWPDRTKGGEKCDNAKGKVYCLGGKTHIAILSDLKVVPCCLDSGGEITLGNLKEQSLKDILSSRKFINLTTAFNNGKPAQALCATCRYSQK